MTSFDGKVALVTGAASGMGLATARAFAEAGAAVALADVNEAAVRAAADGLVAGGWKAIGLRCNVADEADVSGMVEQTVSASDGLMLPSTMPAYSRRRSRRRMSAVRNSIA
jgi:NAD(P)-dependent dehydrogenase (short-subunit alcohol dehydrogenase family)